MELIPFLKRRLSPGLGQMFSASLFLAAGALGDVVELQADTFITYCTEEYLRSALSQGGRVVLNCGSVTPRIALSEPLVIETNVTLEVPHYPGGPIFPVTLDGRDATSLFRVRKNGRLNLIGLALTRGRAPRGAAIFNEGGSVTISNCSFTANVATGAPPDIAAGGAIYSQGGDLTIWQSQFVSNRTSGGRSLDLSSVQARGGAISQDGGRLKLETCTFQENTANGGLAFEDPSFLRARARGSSFGGAIALTAVEGTLTRCIFQTNSAESSHAPQLFADAYGADVHGGALYHDELSRVHLEFCHFLENRARGGAGFRGARSGTGYGGAIFSFGPLWASNCGFTGNITMGGSGSFRGGDSFGGALYTVNARIRACTFVSNNARAAYACNCGSLSYPGGDALGGAIFNAGLLEMNECWFSSNWTDVEDAYLVGHFKNPGQSYGGGLSTAGECFVTNSTWFQNRVVAAHLLTPSRPEGPARGAAIYQVRGRLFLDHCTIASNAVIASPTNASAALVISSGASAQLLGCILSGNTNKNAAGTILDQGYNLSSDDTPGFTAATSQSQIDPGLGPPGDYGGPTLSLGLLPGSRALDAIPAAVRTVAIDQRGVPRPIGPGSDIGAFEYLPPAVFEWRNGQFQVQHILRPDKDYRVESSTDLETWSFLSVAPADSRGKLLFSDPDSAAVPYRFYRAREQ